MNTPNIEGYDGDGKKLTTTKGVLYYAKHPEELDELTFTFSSPPDKNYLGNGWTNGYKNPWDLWNEPEDAEYEIIQPRLLEPRTDEEQMNLDPSLTIEYLTEEQIIEKYGINPSSTTNDKE